MALTSSGAGGEVCCLEVGSFHMRKACFPIHTSMHSQLGLLFLLDLSLCFLLFILVVWFISYLGNWVVIFNYSYRILLFYRINVGMLPQFITTNFSDKFAEELEAMTE